MDRDFVHFTVVASQHEPGRVAVQAIFGGGHVVARPDITQARDLVRQLNEAIAQADRLARQSSRAEAAA